MPTSPGPIPELPWEPPADAFKFAVENMHFGVAFIDPKTQRFLWLNDAFASLIGYTPFGLIGQTWMSITDGPNLPEDLANIECVLEGRREHYEMSKRYIHRNGTRVPVHLEVFRYPKAGSLVCLMATIQEDAITAHRAEQFRTALRGEMKELVVQLLQPVQHQVAAMEAPVKVVVEQHQAMAAVVRWIPQSLPQVLGATLLSTAAAFLGWIGHILYLLLTYK